MSKKKAVSTISLDDEWVERVVDIVQEELEIPTLDIEQRESLEKVVMLSIAMYFMCAREHMNKTTKLTQ